MFGFLVLEDFVFGQGTALVVDPGEEKLRLEFEGVKRSLIPMQSVIRIDEVEKQGTPKLRDGHKGSQDKITPFPGGLPRKGNSENKP